MRIYPTDSIPSVEPVTVLKEVMKNSAVQFRGWDYPHTPTANNEHQGMYVSGESVEAWIDMDQYKEVWRIFTNGQIIHLFGLREDWWGEDTWLSPDHPLKKIKPNTLLDVIGATYSITEMYAFFRNLSESFYPEGSRLCVEISLFGTNRRKLQVLDPRRFPLFDGYECHTENVVLPKISYSREELMEKYVDLAFEQIKKLIAQFNWDNPSLGVIQDDQKKLIERRI